MIGVVISHALAASVGFIASYFVCRNNQKLVDKVVAALTPVVQKIVADAKKV